MATINNEKMKIFCAENKLYKNLHDNLLSPMDKDRYEFSKEKIEQAKTMYLDYLYTIVNLIKFS